MDWIVSTFGAMGLEFEVRLWVKWVAHKFLIYIAEVWDYSENFGAVIIY